MEKKEEEVCSICLENLKGRCKLHTTKCNHTFHAKCFSKVKKSVCPCCRTPFEKDKKNQIVEIKQEIKQIEKDFKRNIRYGKELKSLHSKNEKKIQSSLKREMKTWNLLFCDAINADFRTSGDTISKRVRDLSTELENVTGILKDIADKELECFNFFTDALNIGKAQLLSIENK